MNVHMHLGGALCGQEAEEGREKVPIDQKTPDSCFCCSGVAVLLLL